MSKDNFNKDNNDHNTRKVSFLTKREREDDVSLDHEAKKQKTDESTTEGSSDISTESDNNSDQELLNSNDYLSDIDPIPFAYEEEIEIMEMTEAFMNFGNGEADRCFTPAAYAMPLSPPVITRNVRAINNIEQDLSNDLEPRALNFGDADQEAVAEDESFDLEPRALNFDDEDQGAVAEDESFDLEPRALNFDDEDQGAVVEGELNANNDGIIANRYIIIRVVGDNDDIEEEDGESTVSFLSEDDYMSVDESNVSVLTGQADFNY